MLRTAALHSSLRLHIRLHLVKFFTATFHWLIFTDLLVLRLKERRGGRTCSGLNGLWFLSYDLPEDLERAGPISDCPENLEGVEPTAIVTLDTRRGRGYLLWL